MSSFDENSIMKIGRVLHDKYAPADLIVNQIVMTENGVLVIFTIEQKPPLLPQQRVAMFDVDSNCEWDHAG